MHAATWTLPALIFITAGAAQMALWAKAKHARLRKACANNLLSLHPAVLHACNGLACR